jgi:NNP family nitrate/nitrite transporter-like MFS transporter
LHGTAFSRDQAHEIYVQDRMLEQGADNWATFQMVPPRWPITIAPAGGVMGEIGAPRGPILPIVLSQSRQHTGSYTTGFRIYAGIAACILLMLRLGSRSWTRMWVGHGGRTLTTVSKTAH